jgi:sugar phosphate isomerase/epimerase
MLIGAMNHPERNVLDEIATLADAGMEFLDLTLEPPASPSWAVDSAAIRAKLDSCGMGVVGHTAWYLPMASAIPEIREAAVMELKRCLDRFGEIGAKWMNLHPDRHTPWHPRQFYIDRNIDTIHELLSHAKKCGVGLMVENLPGDYNSAPQLGDLLDRVPELALHLDIGHANLQVPHNTTREILEAHGKRLRHVHLHDNKGGHADLHLPLGTGTVDLVEHIRSLQSCGYDGTITLEVFSPDRHYLEYSRDLLRRAWDEERAKRSNTVELLSVH